MKNKWIIVLLIAIMMMLVVTGCGKSDESATSASEEATQTKEEIDYDIAANIKEIVDEGGEKKTIETDHFKLTLGLPNTWTYEQISMTSIIIFNDAGRMFGDGGTLFTLSAYDPDDKSYEDISHYSVAGESDGKVYIAEYPEDAQADVNDETHQKEYEEIYDEVMKIESGAKDSPLEIK